MLFTRVTTGTRRTAVSRWASCFACWGVLFVLLAGALPMFAVTSLEGHGRIAQLVDVDVDLRLGDGIFLRNVCFGGTTPDEAVLNRFGLSCKGQAQIDETCYKQAEDANSADDLDDKCRQFIAMQALEGSAVLAGVTALVFGGLSAHIRFFPFRFTFRTVATIAAMVAWASAAGVLAVANESYLGRNYECLSGVPGFSLCRERGASFPLQWIGIICFLLATIFNFLLVCFVPDQEDTEAYVAVPVNGTVIPLNATAVPTRFGSGIVVSEGVVHSREPLLASRVAVEP